MSEFPRASSPLGYNDDKSELDNETFERLRRKWASRLSGEETASILQTTPTPSNRASAKRTVSFMETSPSVISGRSVTPTGRRVSPGPSQSPLLQAATRTSGGYSVGRGQQNSEREHTAEHDPAIPGIMARLQSLEDRTGQPQPVPDVAAKCRDMGRVTVAQPASMHRYHAIHTEPPRTSPSPGSGTIFVNKQHLFFGSGASGFGGSPAIVRELRIRNTNSHRAITVNLSIDRRSHAVQPSPYSHTSFSITSPRTLYLKPMETETIQIAWRPPTVVRSARLQDYYTRAKLVIECPDSAFQVPLLAVNGEPLLVMTKTAAVSTGGKLQGSAVIENKGTAPAFIEFSRGVTPDTPVVMPGAVVACTIACTSTMAGVMQEHSVAEFTYDCGSEPLRALAAMAGATCPLGHVVYDALGRESVVAEDVLPWFLASTSTHAIRVRVVEK
ncbi:hypothetical protein J8273_8130 [Carpediemonas membranifera]|uniref:Uncharacterized protein n=1 Tax=Carpediemonas membranifera TaxID=201153 RepID=A0A8J6AWK0_9EUKA|nr:hypothetical protein J8273_8130 [Carpediemonas membranifera]|eukprot:KAG9390093.1 hypothetical protein J8273_8130 [Carpediemonas membranifera]